LLIENRNKMMPVEELYTAVWGQEMNSSTQALRTVISRLNRKLPPELSHVTISFIRNQGYILEQVDRNK
jgi:DNA-binding response OmpR family regulator